jgi:hypothetical protein
MRETAKIVAQTLVFSPLKTLENQYMAEFEILANRIAYELLNKNLLLIHVVEKPWFTQSI